MPYEMWYGLKLNVAHLHEFGMSVWVLLQGQVEQCKILPKSKQHIYMWGTTTDSKQLSITVLRAERYSPLVITDFLSLQQSTPHVMLL